MAETDPRAGDGIQSQQSADAPDDAFDTVPAEDSTFEGQSEGGTPIDSEAALDDAHDTARRIAQAIRTSLGDDYDDAHAVKAIYEMAARLDAVEVPKRSTNVDNPPSDSVDDADAAAPSADEALTAEDRSSRHDDVLGAMLQNAERAERQADEADAQDYDEVLDQTGGVTDAPDEASYGSQDVAHCVSMVLGELGLDNLEVTCEDAPWTWLLVKVEGSWYHLDAALQLVSDREAEALADTDGQEETTTAPSGSELDDVPESVPLTDEPDTMAGEDDSAEKADDVASRALLVSDEAIRDDYLHRDWQLAMKQPGLEDSIGLPACPVSFVWEDGPEAEATEASADEPAHDEDAQDEGADVEVTEPSESQLVAPEGQDHVGEEADSLAAEEESGTPQNDDVTPELHRDRYRSH